MPCNPSIGPLDPEVWKLTEPGTPHPARRLEAVRKLNAAGVPTGVLVAPIIPGLSDGEEQLRELVGACLDAGAVSVVPVVLHLRPGVREHVLQWAQRTRPDLAACWERRYRRAYLPAAAARAITDRVHAAVADRRGPPAAGRRARRAAASPACFAAAGGKQVKGGAQGAPAGDIGRAFGGCPEGTVLPAASRALLACGPRGVRGRLGEPGEPGGHGIQRPAGDQVAGRSRCRVEQCPRDLSDQERVAAGRCGQGAQVGAGRRAENVRGDLAHRPYVQRFERDAGRA